MCALFWALKKSGDWGSLYFYPVWGAPSSFHRELAQEPHKIWERYGSSLLLTVDIRLLEQLEVSRDA